MHTQKILQTRSWRAARLFRGLGWRYGLCQRYIGGQGLTEDVSEMSAVTSRPLSWISVGANALAIGLCLQGDGVGVVTEVVQEAGDGEVEVHSGPCRLRFGEIP